MYITTRSEKTAAQFYQGDPIKNDSPYNPPPSCIIAAPASGSGKTTLALGVMRALTRRGLKVQPYKAGPDYLDGTYHTLATGTPSYNLDCWMIDAKVLSDHFSALLCGKDTGIIEGAMGLFDGFEGTIEGSSAQLAALLGIPVLLVVDCKGMSGSVAPLVNGFAAFRPDVKIAGVILNRTGSERHVRYLKEALTVIDIPVVGYLPREDSLALEHRHLGLIAAQHGGSTEQKIDAIAGAVEKTVDLDLLLRLCRGAPEQMRPVKTIGRKKCSCRIAVARDAAFHFYYQANLDLLEQEGAELAFFSPLRDVSLPEGTDGVLLGGGYPEEHAAALADNEGMRTAIRTFSETGRCVYAECGGFMYLGDHLEKEGNGYPMCGVFPVGFCMNDRKRKSLGYREITLAVETILGPEGTNARGHEFHYSLIKEYPGILCAPFSILPRIVSKAPEPAGMAIRNTVGSYLHIHFLSNPVLARNIVDSCNRWCRRKECR
jgi:cobyrinic acid a,c-diamide synthase